MYFIKNNNINYLIFIKNLFILSGEYLLIILLKWDFDFCDVDNIKNPTL